MQSFQEKAKAKINLNLHILGKRDDGYHELESLVTFCDFHDVLTFTPSESFEFTCAGDFSSSLDAAENLCVKAARLMAQKFQQELRCHIHLRKNIPVAGGLGGGSSDAAATVRGLLRFWDIDFHEDLTDLALSLGADVPVCLKQESVVMRGVGELIEAVDLPDMNLVLVNPRMSCNTAKVFSEFKGGFFQSMSTPKIQNYDELVKYLQQTENQLSVPAQNIVKQIKEVKDVLLQQEGVGFAGLSGSGATCFGLFKSHEQAINAAKNIAAEHTGWWVVSTKA